MTEIPKEILDQLLSEYKSPEDLLGESGILKSLSKALLERILEAELSDHVGYKKNGARPINSDNTRNGTTKKRLKTKNGDLELSIPRDRESSFEPIAVKKHQRRFDGFDEKIISMYSRGMSVRDIQGHLKDIYGTDISPDLISTVTSEVMDEVHSWQNRPLDPVYPIVYLDAIRIKVRDDGQIINKAFYLALGVNIDGQKDLLGIWISKNEGAKFWMTVINELKNRGVEDILIACVDGLKGFPEAIESVFPKTQVQLCIVHMIRHSLKFVSWKDRKSVAKDLKPIYTAVTEKQAKVSLEGFSKKWDSTYPTISASWQKNWESLVPFLQFPKDIRKAIYTTNAIESLNHSLRKLIKTRGAFPTDDAVLKLLYLGLKNISKKWTMPIRNWSLAINQFAIFFPNRISI